MTDSEDSNDITSNEKVQCATGDKGTASLLIGAGFGAYGTTIVAASGVVCPVCVIAAPLFLGLGAVQRISYTKKNKKEGVSSSSMPQDETI